MKFIPYIPVIYAFVFIFSMMAHEYAHALAALYCGDDTAKKAGRLTINPKAHYDLWGSIIIPLALLLFHVNMIIGWAKPVPINFDIMGKKQKTFVVGAGVIANLILAFAGLIFYHLTFHLMTEDSSLAIQLCCIGGFLFFPTNLALAVFNLVPIRPLDGWLMLNFLYPKVQVEHKNWQYFLSGFCGVAFMVWVVKPVLGVIVNTAMGR